MSDTSKAGGSVTERERLLARARAARDAITDEENVRIRGAALADPDAQPVDRLMRRKPGRPPTGLPRKQPVLLNIDPDVIERFKADGPGWQTRMNAALRKAAGLP
jgi:uncharacterized protein (DUF4415 family)